MCGGRSLGSNLVLRKNKKNDSINSRGHRRRTRGRTHGVSLEPDCHHNFANEGRRPSSYHVSEPFLDRIVFSSIDGGDESERVVLHKWILLLKVSCQHLRTDDTLENHLLTIGHNSSPQVPQRRRTQLACALARTCLLHGPFSHKAGCHPVQVPLRT